MPHAHLGESWIHYLCFGTCQILQKLTKNALVGLTTFTLGLVKICPTRISEIISFKIPGHYSLPLVKTVAIYSLDFPSVQKKWHNSKRKSAKPKMEPDIVYKFQMICLRGILRY